MFRGEAALSTTLLERAYSLSQNQHRFLSSPLRW